MSNRREVTVVLSPEEAEHLEVVVNVALEEEVVEHPAPFALKSGRNKLRAALNKGEGEQVGEAATCARCGRSLPTAADRKYVHNNIDGGGFLCIGDGCAGPALPVDESQAFTPQQIQQVLGSEEAVELLAEGMAKPHPLAAWSSSGQELLRKDARNGLKLLATQLFGEGAGEAPDQLGVVRGELLHRADQAAKVIGMASPESEARARHEEQALRAAISFIDNLPASQPSEVPEQGEGDRFAMLTGAEREHVLDALHYAAENGSRDKAAIYDRLIATQPDPAPTPQDQEKR